MYLQYTVLSGTCFFGVAEPLEGYICEGIMDPVPKPIRDDNHSHSHHAWFWMTDSGLSTLPSISWPIRKTKAFNLQKLIYQKVSTSNVRPITAFERPQTFQAEGMICAFEANNGISNGYDVLRSGYPAHLCDFTFRYRPWTISRSKSWIESSNIGISNSLPPPNIDIQNGYCRTCSFAVLLSNNL